MSKLVEKSKRLIALFLVLQPCGFHPVSVFFGKPSINKVVRTPIMNAKYAIRERYLAELSNKADRHCLARSQNSKFKVKNYENKTVGSA
jgi:hypothetical protein